MTIRADRDPRYYWRFWLIGLVALGFACWALYDGQIGYPAQRELRQQVYQKLQDEGREDRWSAHALDKGWPVDTPGSEKEIEHFDMSIKEQYLMAVVAGAAGLAVLFGVWRSRGRWIEANETGLTSSWGQSFDYDSVVSLDKRLWRGKGIAKVYYQDAGTRPGGSRRRKFVVDDFKFHRRETDALLRELEARIDPDKITGGPPESAGEQPASQQ